MNFKGIEICCPRCKGDLEFAGVEMTALDCSDCGERYPVILGIPDLRVFPDPYIGMEADRVKGKHIADQLDKLTFEELVEYYYSQTQVVPLAHARMYTCGLMAAPARAGAALQSWESMMPANCVGQGGVFLEIGCGTAPLLVAAATHYDRLVGIDIAFRWLVVGKKRLQEAGLDIPLICACAEALPFPDRIFDCVAAESTLEHLHDQGTSLGESYRVLRPDGRLYLSTPNRYSLGPDPQAGIWAGGYLPQSWVAAYVKRQGGVPPKRRLLSKNTLAALVDKVGFTSIRIYPPDVPEGQSKYYSKSMKILIGGYRFARRWRVSSQAMLRVGPLMHLVACKGPAG